MRNLAAASILSLCLTGGTFAQAPPIYLPFDGIVVDECGTPRTGNISLVFSLYEDKVDGVPVWVEVQPVQTARIRCSWAARVAASQPIRSSLASPAGSGCSRKACQKVLAHGY